MLFFNCLHIFFCHFWATPHFHSCLPHTQRHLGTFGDVTVGSSRYKRLVVGAAWCWGSEGWNENDLFVVKIKIWVIFNFISKSFSFSKFQLHSKSSFSPSKKIILFSFQNRFHFQKQKSFYFKNFSIPKSFSFCILK